MSLSPARAGAILVMALLPVICGCSKPPASQVTPETPAADAGPALTEGTVIVFAAASLTEALDDFAAQYESSHPGVTLRLNYAGTQELRIQMEQGAPCDVFISASREHMNALVDADLVQDARVLAHNKLCVIADTKGKRVQEFSDLTDPGIRIIVATEQCPAGKYTRMSWEKMGASSDFGPAFIAALHRNVVSEETNVKLVVSKIVLGEADAGFVYASDAINQDVKLIELPEQVQVTATYMVGVSTESSAPGLAGEFIDALMAPEGQEAFTALGLDPPKPTE